MTELPTGTATFLVSDIEGSTRLLQEHADEDGALLARHRELLEPLTSFVGRDREIAEVLALLDKARLDAIYPP